jgi:hypothetical protein
VKDRCCSGRGAGAAAASIRLTCCNQPGSPDTLNVQPAVLILALQRQLQEFGVRTTSAILPMNRRGL